MNVGGLYIVLNILNILISFWIVMKEMSTNFKKENSEAVNQNLKYH